MAQMEEMERRQWKGRGSMAGETRVEGKEKDAAMERERKYWIERWEQIRFRGLIKEIYRIKLIFVSFYFLQDLVKLKTIELMRTLSKGSGREKVYLIICH